jgi:threonine synthase
VVCVSTASGLKFTEFKVRYHEGSIEQVDSARANPPVMLPPKFGDVVDAINRRFS